MERRARGGGTLPAPRKPGPNPPRAWHPAGTQHGWLRGVSCVQDTTSGGVVILLLGNKMDCDKERQVSEEAGQQLAQVSTWVSASPPAWTGQTPPWRVVDTSLATSASCPPQAWA